MPAPRRLLTVGHSYVVTLNRRLADAMARAAPGRWEVTAVAPRFMHGDLGPIRCEPNPAEACRTLAVGAYLTRRTHVMMYGLGLRKRLRENWDVVHAWEEPYILPGGQIAWWTPPRTPLAFTSFQNLTKTYPPPFSWIERMAVRRAAGWIAVTENIEATLLPRPGYAARPHAVIPIGVDVEAFRPNPVAGAAVRHALGWGAGPPVVGYLGRFVPEKGLALLTRALDRVAAPWRALLVGGGPEEALLRTWAAKHGDRVRVVTGVPHDGVPAHLAAMDLLAAPSQSTPQWCEQLGRMLIEAFACGVPVIGSDSGEIPFVLAGAGVVVGERDEAGWTKALGDLIESPARRAEVAAAGLERAHRRYAWPVVAAAHLAFFDRLRELPRP